MVRAAKTADGPSVAVVGVTGAVGQEFLKVLHERNFPYSNMKLLASARSAGKKYDFEGVTYTGERPYRFAPPCPTRTPARSPIASQPTATCMRRAGFPSPPLRPTAPCDPLDAAPSPPALAVEELKEDSFEGVDIALFSAGGSISKKFAPIAAEAGTYVVDNSSCFRMTEGIPLVSPPAWTTSSLDPPRRETPPSTGLDRL